MSGRCGSRANIIAGMGLLLQHWRERRGLSLRALGARSGVSFVTIQRTEAGLMSPTVATLEKLAAALGVSVRDLFPDTGSAALALRERAVSPVANRQQGRLADC